MHDIPLDWSERPTGEEIVKQGLAQEQEITALVRDASKLVVSDSNLRQVLGDILSAQDADAAIAGQDALVCSLGTGVTFKHVTLFSEGTQHLLSSSASPASVPATAAATMDPLRPRDRADAAAHDLPGQGSEAR